jgi:uroporphyrinogen decarboxylase
MSEYRALRQKYTLLDICRAPDLAAEVTFQPIQRFRLDAAIIFADILLPLEGLGVPFEFLKGEGPVIHEPIRSARQVEALRAFDPTEELRHVLEAVRIVRRELSPEIALIGFAGGPFTIASYLIEGGSSRHFAQAKRFMYAEEAAWHRLLDCIARVTLDYLRAQVESGADAVQLFDSWVGCLGPDDYRKYVMPHSSMIFRGLRDLDIPTIHFGTGTSSLLELLREAGGTVIGVDWRVEIDVARRRLGNSVAIQGNLDPVAMFAPRPVLLEKVENILAKVGGEPGHIFNLGHGILPQTPVESVQAVVQKVSEASGG